MAKVSVVKATIKKYFNIDVEGNSDSALLEDLMRKMEHIPGHLTERQMQLLLDANVKPASTVINGQEVHYESLDAAITAINATEGGAELFINKDTEVPAKLVVKKDATINLDGCVLSNPNNGTIFQVTDGATITINADGAQIYGRIDLGTAPNNNGNVIINGGEFSCGDDQTCLHINGTCTDSSVEINGAKIYSPHDNGIQLNGSGKFVINGCEIIGATGVYIKSGEVEIVDSHIVGTMEPANYSYYGNGANATGDGIVIDSCEYPGGAPVVHIGDGVTIEATKDEVGYYEYDANKDGKTDPATITSEKSIYSVSDGYKWQKSGGEYELVKK